MAQEMTASKKLVPVLSALVSCASLVGIPDDAKACEPPPCAQARVATRAGTAVPTSTTAFPYFPSQHYATAPDGGEQVFRLLDPQGAEIALSVQDDPKWSGGKLLVPNAPLTASTGYRIAYDESCGNPSGPVERAFAVSGQSALPYVAGTLFGKDPVVGARDVPTSSGSCYESVEAVAIDLRLAPSKELAAFAPLTAFTVLVDGQETVTSYYGEANADGNDLAVGTLVALCAPNGSAFGNVSLGEHTVALRAHVAGAASDPLEVTTKLWFSCDGSADDAGLGCGCDEGGIPERDSGSPDASTPVNPVNDATPDRESAGGGGCSTTGTNAFGGGSVLLVATALGLRVFFMRRRRA